MLESAFYRGSVYTETGSNVTLAARAKAVQIVKPTTTGLRVTLPDATKLRAAGGPGFWIGNDSAIDLEVRDSSGVLLATLGGAIGESATGACVVFATDITDADGWAVRIRRFSHINK